MKILIDKHTVSSISEPFRLDQQVTVYAFNLEPTDSVTFDMISMTAPRRADCVCPPGQVEFPTVDDALPLKCCDTTITLTRANPWVIIDAPQGAFLRATLTAAQLIAQVVGMNETATTFVTERMRGCSCAPSNNT